MPHSLRRPPMPSTLWITDICDISLFPLPPLILHALPRQRRDRSRYWLMTKLLTSSQPPVAQRREDGSIYNRAPMHLMLANANTDPQNNHRHIHTNLKATKWGLGGGEPVCARSWEREERNSRETKSHMAYTQEGRIVAREPGAHADHHLQLPASPIHFIHLGFRAPNPNPMRTKP